MSEQTDTTPAIRTRRNKIGAMRASPSLTAADAAPKRRGRPPKQAMPATNAKDSNAGTVAQPKRSLAHARLIARVDALVGEHDVKRIGKLLDAVQGLR